MTQVTNSIAVEVAYATPEKQLIINLDVAAGTTAKQAAIASKIDQHFPQINLATDVMGIFSNTLGSKGLAAADEYILKQGDRVEIYRPLIADPKQARKQRAQKTTDEPFKAH